MILWMAVVTSEKKSPLCLIIWVCLHGKQWRKAVQLVKPTALCFFASSPPPPKSETPGPTCELIFSISVFSQHILPKYKSTRGLRFGFQKWMILMNMNQRVVVSEHRAWGLKCESGNEQKITRECFSENRVNFSLSTVHLRSLMTKPWNLMEGEAIFV